MSKYGKSGIKAKHNFRRNLEQFAKEQIEEYLRSNHIDEEIDAFQTEQEFLEKLYAEDIELGLFSYPDEDDWMPDDYPYDPDWDLEDDYVFEDDYKYSYLCNSGDYYKDEAGKTYLCIEIETRKMLVSVLTGLREYPTKLQKVGYRYDSI